MIKKREITKQPDELDAVKKNAGITPAPVQDTSTPGIRNQDRTMQGSKETMGQPTTMPAG